MSVLLFIRDAMNDISTLLSVVTGLVVAAMFKMIFVSQWRHSIAHRTWLRQRGRAIFVNSDDISSVGDSKCSRNAFPAHKPIRMDRSTNDIYTTSKGYNANAIHTLTMSNTNHMDSSTDPSTFSFTFVSFFFLCFDWVVASATDDRRQQERNDEKKIAKLSTKFIVK